MRDEKLLARVAEIQKEFVYDHMVDTKDHQVWYCHKPGTSIYSFELFFGLRGITMMGDIDPLVFTVARNIGFLAGKDVDYYIHSKLDHAFYDQRELDPKSRDNWIKDRLADYLRNSDDPKISEEFNKLAAELSFDERSLEDVIGVFERLKLDDKYEYEIWEVFEDGEGIDDLQEMYEFAYKYDEDVWECNFGKPAKSVMFCLYMVCYAARQIKEKVLETAGT